MSVNPWNDTMQHAITEVQARITAVYPEATFRLVEGEDPVWSKNLNVCSTGAYAATLIHPSA